MREGKRPTRPNVVRSEEGKAEPLLRDLLERRAWPYKVGVSGWRWWWNWG
jgi:hypothetical protein